MIEIPDCPICGSAAAVTHTVADGVVRFRCAFTHGGVGPHVWDALVKTATAKTATAKTATAKTATAKTASLVKTNSGWAATGGVTADLVAPLWDIVTSFPKVWIEHRVLEYAADLGNS
ncbi:MAG: hypothetical protein DLM58_15300, partial [Pseudonocardiales bacterium]